MTKADIVAKIADKLGLERNDIQKTVESFMEEVKTSLEKDENVYLRGFGSFIIYKRSTMMGRNPKTGEALLIKSKHLVRFRAGKELKKRVDESSKQYPI
jgi:DNA-binding protein HU-beta